jgi:Tol biopolymer transport system component
MHTNTHASLLLVAIVATAFVAGCAPDAPVGVTTAATRPVGEPTLQGNAAKTAKIAFASGDEGSRNIYTMNPDGTEQTAITTGRNAASPAWSPDRRRLLLVEMDGPDGMIFVMNRNGTHVTQLLRGNNPSWSPDGETIALDKTGVGSREVMTIRSPFLGYNLVTQNGVVDEDPTWSPDAKRVAYVRRPNGAGEIAFRQLGVAGETQVTTCAAQGLSCSGPVWSPVPGDDRILFAVTGAVTGLFTIKPNGTGLAAVKTFASGLALEPTWSPDGTRIAFTLYAPGKAADIYRVNADGTGLVQLTTDPRDDVAPAGHVRQQPTLTLQDYFHALPFQIPRGARRLGDRHAGRVYDQRADRRSRRVPAERRAVARGPER